MNVMMMEMNTETMDSGSVYMLVSMLMPLHDDDVAHDDDAGKFWKSNGQKRPIPLRISLKA